MWAVCFPSVPNSALRVRERRLPALNCFLGQARENARGPQLSSGEDVGHGSASVHLAKEGKLPGGRSERLRRGSSRDVRGEGHRGGARSVGACIRQKSGRWIVFLLSPQWRAIAS